jgi:hypothetical protein
MYQLASWVRFAMVASAFGIYRPRESNLVLLHLIDCRANAILDELSILCRVPEIPRLAVLLARTAHWTVHLVFLA